MPPSEIQEVIKKTVPFIVMLKNIIVQAFLLKLLFIIFAELSKDYDVNRFHLVFHDPAIDFPEIQSTL